MSNGHTQRPKQQPLFAMKKKSSCPKTGPQPLPDWLRRQIETQDPATFGKLARWQICPRCQAVTLAGWDAYYDYAGFEILEPAKLDTMGELFAILAGRRTFELRTDKEGKKTISTRDHHRILASPATGHTWPVLPQHRCFEPIGTKLEPRNLNGNK